MIWNGDLAKNALQEAAARGLNKAAEQLKGDSNAISPKDTGHLIDTSDVAQATASDLTAQVFYDTPYAARLHEGVGYHFNRSKNPKAQAKFLEKPLRENKDTYRDIIGAEIERSL